jgi:hypothetical protein
MLSLRRLLPAATTLLVVAAPRPAQAQSGVGTVVASATVLARPLTLLAMSWTAVPGELRIQLDGCGSGALTVDTHSASATTRTSRLTFDATPGCGSRAVSVQLPRSSDGALEYVVTLQQTDALLSPAFAQFTLAASTVTGARKTLGY